MVRLWHKDLLQVLPRQQLVSQWRECCCIAKSISEKGTPNHILVNRIMNYQIDHFLYYSGVVEREMHHRGYKCNWREFEKYGLYTDDGRIRCDMKMLFYDWHNNIYLRECLYNLEEKYICGGIPAEEWKRIYDMYGNKFGLVVDMGYDQGLKDV